MDVAVALEGMYELPRWNKLWRLEGRVSGFLETTADDGPRIRENRRMLYETRSDIVHGGSGEVRPLAFIWHRKHYTEGAGQATREEFERQWARMSPNDKSELMEIIGSGGGTTGLRKACKEALESKGTSWRVREVLPCYAMETRGERNIELDREIAEKLRQGIAIEDAGLEEAA